MANLWRSLSKARFPRGVCRHSLPSQPSTTSPIHPPLEEEEENQFSSSSSSSCSALAHYLSPAQPTIPAPPRKRFSGGKLAGSGVEEEFKKMRCPQCQKWVRTRQLTEHKKFHQQGPGEVDLGVVY